MIKTKLTKGSLHLFTFTTDSRGMVCARLGSVKVVEGYNTVKDCSNAVRRFLQENDGLQIEY